MATAGYSIFIYYLTCLTLANAEICSEPWRLERDSTDPVFVGFINGTFPGRYTSLIWRWAAIKLKGEWETTIWKSFVSDNLLGSMAFRDGDGKVPVSLTWRYQNGNLTWLSRISSLADVNWSVKVCNMPVWAYETDKSGNWIFKLGNMILQDQEGEKIINNIEEIMILDSENFIRSYRNKRHIIRVIGEQRGNGERTWEIIRDILERVFGNSDTIKEEGWISHITNFLYLIAGALGGSASNGNGATGIIQSRPSIATTLPPEVETFNPSTLDATKIARKIGSRFSNHR